MLPKLRRSGLDSMFLGGDILHKAIVRQENNT